MMAFSVLPPYYNEEVLYNKEHQRTENEDGVSTLFYLQKIYDDEWRNFLERMHREGMVYENEIWNNKLKDLRFWASSWRRTLASSWRDQKTLLLMNSEASVAFRGHEYGTTLRKYTNFSTEKETQSHAAVRVGHTVANCTHLKSDLAKDSAKAKDLAKAKGKYVIVDSTPDETILVDGMSKMQRKRWRIKNQEKTGTKTLVMDKNVVSTSSTDIVVLGYCSVLFV
ncbi:hypothetical protein IFM89_030535 [Coptis chinensis]|uniref:Glycosyl transferase 48 domain-containing protein n=1 Tax=Coptis chinensis TaxID=261450 RepID=A0A835LRX7_9MAGN|nr:hypothetical protein IFM89_030535 [Coptis chinensis]